MNDNQPSEQAPAIAMNGDVRDTLLRLHRAAMKAEFYAAVGDLPAKVATEADDAFRNYLFAVQVAA